jgi:hypothetical protein
VIGGDRVISSAQQRQAQFAFIVFPILYSVGFFGWCSLAEKMPIFSKRNSRSMPSVICGHVSVLLLLAMLAQMTFRFYPSLPNWLTDQTFRLRGSEHSVFEVLGIIFVLTIGAIEKRWIYIDSGTDNSEAMDRPS